MKPAHWVLLAAAAAGAWWLLAPAETPVQTLDDLGRAASGALLQPLAGTTLSFVPSLQPPGDASDMLTFTSAPGHPSAVLPRDLLMPSPPALGLGAGGTRAVFPDVMSVDGGPSMLRGGDNL